MDRLSYEDGPRRAGRWEFVRGNRNRAVGRSAGLIAPVATAVLALAACTSTTSGTGGQKGGAATGPTGSSTPAASSSSSSSSPAPVPKAVITINPARVKTYNPTAPVTVSVAHGRVESVTMLNP